MDPLGASPAQMSARAASRRLGRITAPQRRDGLTSDLIISNEDAHSAEFYVDWSSHPVAVAFGRAPFPEEKWEVAGIELRRRVLAALAPKAVNGWALDGTFTAAVTWDRESDQGRDLYFGCWVRLRRVGP
jgi:hypothetical protein